MPDRSGRAPSSRTVAERAVQNAKKPGKWEGIVEVCKTCDRKAQWPFCEHKTDDGSWYRLAVVREVGR